MKLAIVASHPVQYNSPWLAMLAGSGKVIPRVFYTWSQSQQGTQFDPGFGKVVSWDIPLLEGYEYEIVENISTDPGTHHFQGIINPQLIPAIRRWQPQALLVIGWSFNSHLRCMRYFHGKIPVLFRGDSTLLDERGGLKQIARRLFLRYVYRHIDCALYTGTQNKKYFLAHGVKNNKLQFAPHAIDNNRFSNRETEHAEKAATLRRQLGFSPNDIVVLFAGKLEPKKDPAIILSVAEKFQDTQLRFLLVGNGQLEKELKEKAAEMKHVKFIDFKNQSEMPVIYRAGDIFLLPSKGPGETWGLALNEAMACGRAVIASNKTGGAIDLIKHGENGYIFPAENQDALLKCLQQCNDKEELAAMGMRSREIIQTWNFESIVKAITEVLKASK